VIQLHARELLAPLQAGRNGKEDTAAFHGGRIPPRFMAVIRSGVLFLPIRQPLSLPFNLFRFQNMPTPGPTAPGGGVHPAFRYESDESKALSVTSARLEPLKSVERCSRSLWFARWTRVS
jgi:hypothetical protein